MDIGIVGLADGNVARRLARGGVRVLGFDSDGRAATLADENVLIAMPSAVAPIADDPTHGHVLAFGAGPAAARILAPYAQILAPDRGWRRCGPVGSGHYVKTVLAGVDPSPTGAARGVVNEAMALGSATPVSSLALMLQSGRPGGNSFAERLLAAVREHCGDEAVPTMDPIK